MALQLAGEIIKENPIVLEAHRSEYAHGPFGMEACMLQGCL